ncbi:MAG: hypothetical protein IKX74_05500 [Erysipelotrichaceae bacterium]|nr:hypothetical protein [Erysipelotrichaceae bacterium]
MKKVYLMLTRSSTEISTFINMFTGAEYTHSSCSLSETLQPMYSIGRRFTFLNWPAHIKVEPFDCGFYWWHRWARVGIYSLEVSDEGYERMQQFIDSQFARNVQFAFLGMANCAIGRLKEYEGKMFCSQFVANVLKASGEIDIRKEPALFHPVDFLRIKGIRELYRGRIRDLRKLLAEKGKIE